jgi:hypothetical protein
MVVHPDALTEASDEREYQVANFPSILNPKDFRTISSWMLSHYDSLPKRFTTHFFLAPMPPDQEAAHDQLETTDGVWRTPAEALASFERGDFPLVFATIHQLRELAGIESLSAVRARYAQATPRTIRPRVVQREGRAVILHPDDEE